MYNIDMGKNTVQIVKQIDKSDQAVAEAKKIAESIKILPYTEVEKLLDRKASGFLLAKAK
jgi:hypothetical protein